MEYHVEKNGFLNVLWTLSFSLLVDKYVRKFSGEALIVVLESMISLNLSFQKNQMVALRINKCRVNLTLSKSLDYNPWYNFIIMIRKLQSC